MVYRWGWMEGLHVVPLLLPNIPATTQSILNKAKRDKRGEKRERRVEIERNRERERVEINDT